MRISALSVAIFALSTVVSSVHAKDDFSALLADLSFGDATELQAPPAAAAVADNGAEGLKPVPGGWSIPELTPPTTSRQPAQVALQDPVVADQDEINGGVDFDAAFSLQNRPAATVGVPAQSVSHIGRGGQPSGCCESGSCESGGCHSGHYGDAIQCIPHQAPNLPTSTMLQYFRSNPCHSNVWDGYHQRCGFGHKHIHGQCDCFEKSRQRQAQFAPIYGPAPGSDCESCDGVRHR